MRTWQTLWEGAKAMRMWRAWKWGTCAWIAIMMHVTEQCESGKYGSEVNSQGQCWQIRKPMPSTLLTWLENVECRYLSVCRAHAKIGHKIELIILESQHLATDWHRPQVWRASVWAKSENGTRNCNMSQKSQSEVQAFDFFAKMALTIQVYQSIAPC